MKIKWEHRIQTIVTNGNGEEKSFTIAVDDQTMSLVVLVDGKVVADNIDPCGRYLAAAGEVMSAVYKTDRIEPSAPSDRKYLGRLIKALVESVPEPV